MAACLLGAGCGGGDLVLPSNAAPAAAVALRGDDQTGPPGAALPNLLVVKVTDAEDAPVREARVAFSLGAGTTGGETTPDTAFTNDLGEASTLWILGDSEGPQSVNAEVVGTGLPVVSFTATAVADAPAPGPSAERSSVTAAPASIQVATGVAVITVTVRDEDGEPVVGATVTLSATGAGNTLTQPTATTDANGVAEGALQAIVPGAREISAVVNGSIAIEETATVTVEVTPDPEPEPTRLLFLVQPTDTEENETISPAVTVAVVDEEGDVVPVSGIEVELELIRDEDQDSRELEGDTTRDTENGIAVFPDLEVDRDDDGYRLRATAPGRPELGSVDSDSFDIED